MKETSKAVVTVIGKDMVGILAKVSTRGNPVRTGQFFLYGYDY